MVVVRWRKMNSKVVLAVWALAIGLTAWFILFGLSDWMNPRDAIEYIDRNPMRPLFRMAFGIIMTILTLGSAVFVTAKMRAGG